MTRNIDVQLTTFSEWPFILHAREVPGVGVLTLTLTEENLDQLRDRVNDAWLEHKGIERRSVTVEQIEEGDIIPGLGMKVRLWHWIDSSMTSARILMHGKGDFIVPSNMELTVHRVIS